jgi:HSP20 family protein
MGDTFGPYIDGDHFMGRSALGTPWKHALPFANLKYNANDAVFEIAIPGFRKDAIAITIEDTILTITGETEESTSADTKVLSQEFELRPFELKYRLPEDLNLNDPRAEYNNGILQVCFKRGQENTPSAPTQIQVM